MTSANGARSSFRRHGTLPIFETHTPQRLRIACQKQPANRTLESCVIDLVHLLRLSRTLQKFLPHPYFLCLLTSLHLLQSPAPHTDSPPGISSRILPACTSSLNL